MHSRGLYMLAILAGSALAAPLNPRARVCANSPPNQSWNVKSPNPSATQSHRTPLSYRSPFQPRAPPQPLPHTPSDVDLAGDIWCCLGTDTYINVVVQTIIPANSLNQLLGEAFVAILNQVQESGDRVIPAGVFSWVGPAVDGHVACALHAWNAENHQFTWGVLGAALKALWDYMYTNGKFGAADFEVSDGANMVGLGFIGAATATAKSIR